MVDAHEWLLSGRSKDEFDRCDLDSNGVLDAHELAMRSAGLSAEVAGRCESYQNQHNLRSWMDALSEQLRATPELTYKESCDSILEAITLEGLSPSPDIPDSIEAQAKTDKALQKPKIKNKVGELTPMVVAELKKMHAADARILQGQLQRALCQVAEKSDSFEQAELLIKELRQKTQELESDAKSALAQVKKANSACASAQADVAGLVQYKQSAKHLADELTAAEAREKTGLTQLAAAEAREAELTQELTVLLAQAKDQLNTKAPSEHEDGKCDPFLADDPTGDGGWFRRAKIQSMADSMLDSSDSEGEETDSVNDSWVFHSIPFAELTVKQYEAQSQKMTVQLKVLQVPKDL